jgi:hypothetical protein
MGEVPYNEGMKNVRPFRDEPTVLNKAVVAFAYIILAWVVASSSVMQMGSLLSIFFMLGLLVWIFVLRSSRIKYFIRYHVAQAMLLNISLIAFLWLLMAVLKLLVLFPGLNLLAEGVVWLLFDPLFHFSDAMDFSVMMILIMSAGVVLAIYAVRGRYVELPWITDGVRHWV